MKKIGTFIRFVGVGGFATLIHYGTYLVLLKQVQFEPMMSNILAFLISFLVNFVLTHIVTFKVNFSLKKTMGFVLTHSVGFCLNQLIFYGLSFTNLPESILPLGVIPLVTVFNFFFIHRLFQTKNSV